jgi:hypothetical protein
MEKRLRAPCGSNRIGRRRHVVLAAGLVSLFAVGAVNAHASTPQPDRLHSGDVLRAQGISVVVQPPGRGVWAAALEADGGWRVVGVTTAPDGSVSLVRVGAPSAPVGQSSARTDPCSDNAYVLSPDSWNSTYNWYFNASSTPSEISESTATSGLRSAVENIAQANNDCGLADNVSAKQHYQGTTTKSPNIGSSSTCKSSDGTNVVSFGDLASSDLAFTCWWTSGNTTIESDVRLNKFEYTWVVNIGGNCTTKYSVKAVATHEFGHTYGLEHVSEALHGTLTMSPVILPCQSSEKTLGLGDIRGLEAQY